MYASLCREMGEVLRKEPELTSMPLSAGRCVVFAKEPEEGQDAPEPTEEEAEQGPEPLSTVEKDVEVGGAEAWTPLFSSSNSSVKNQVKINKTWGCDYWVWGCGC